MYSLCVRRSVRVCGRNYRNPHPSGLSLTLVDILSIVKRVNYSGVLHLLRFGVRVM